MGHVVALRCLEPGGGSWSHMTRGGSGVALSPARWREPEPRGMWRLRSCPEPGGRSWSYGVRDGSGAALSQEARAGAMGHVAALRLP
jgi:hypothetical protein